MNTSEILSYLDNSFKPFAVNDPSKNGLQVQPPAETDIVGFAVDACMASFELAAQAGAGLLVVHHGLFWRDVELVVDQHYRRLKYLIERKIGLYAMHLPLDAHTEIGNNRQLADIVAADSCESFAAEEGLEIGCLAKFDQPKSLTAIVQCLNETLDTRCHVLPFGDDTITRLGIVSGGGGDFLSDAIAAQCDAFLTGEQEHVMYHLARERGISIIMGGHYATETVGLKALQRAMEADLGIETVFLEHPTGL